MTERTTEEDAAYNRDSSVDTASNPVVPRNRHVEGKTDQDIARRLLKLIEVARSSREEYFTTEDHPRPIRELANGVKILANKVVNRTSVVEILPPRGAEIDPYTFAGIEDLGHYTMKNGARDLGHVETKNTPWPVSEPDVWIEVMEMSVQMKIAAGIDVYITHERVEEQLQEIADGKRTSLPDYDWKKRPELGDELSPLYGGKVLTHSRHNNGVTNREARGYFLQVGKHPDSREAAEYMVQEFQRLKTGVPIQRDNGIEDKAERGAQNKATAPFITAEPFIASNAEDAKLLFDRDFLKQYAQSTVLAEFKYILANGGKLKSTELTMRAAAELTVQDPKLFAGKEFIQLDSDMIKAGELRRLYLADLEASGVNPDPATIPENLGSFQTPEEIAFVSRAAGREKKTADDTKVIHLFQEAVKQHWKEMGTDGVAGPITKSYIAAATGRGLSKQLVDSMQETRTTEMSCAVLDAKGNLIPGLSIKPYARQDPASTTKMWALYTMAKMKGPDFPQFYAENESAIREMMIRSNNDAANALAIKVSGSRESFTEQMNIYAAQALAEHAQQRDPNVDVSQVTSSTHFVTVEGMNDPQHYSTAHDMAVLMRRFQQDGAGIFAGTDKGRKGGDLYLADLTSLEPHRNTANGNPKSKNDDVLGVNGMTGAKTGTAMGNHGSLGKYAMTVSTDTGYNFAVMGASSGSKRAEICREIAKKIQSGEFIGLANYVPPTLPPTINSKMVANSPTEPAVGAAALTSATPCLQSTVVDTNTTARTSVQTVQDTYIEEDTLSLPPPPPATSTRVVIPPPVGAVEENAATKAVDDPQAKALEEVRKVIEKSGAALSADSHAEPTQPMAMNYNSANTQTSLQA